VAGRLGRRHRVCLDERLLAERQIDFDIINIDALATDLKAGPGTLETMSGNQYRTVVIPYATFSPRLRWTG